MAIKKTCCVMCPKWEIKTLQGTVSQKNRKNLKPKLQLAAQPF